VATRSSQPLRTCIVPAFDTLIGWPHPRENGIWCFPTNRVFTMQAAKKNSLSSRLDVNTLRQKPEWFPVLYRTVIFVANKAGLWKTRLGMSHRNIGKCYRVEASSLYHTALRSATEVLRRLTVKVRFVYGLCSLALWNPWRKPWRAGRVCCEREQWLVSWWCHTGCPLPRCDPGKAANQAP
jgi:hypothetical protein